MVGVQAVEFIIRDQELALSSGFPRHSQCDYSGEASNGALYPPP